MNQLKIPPLWILLLLVSFPSIAAVLFTPALPEIAQKLQISNSQAEFTITIFLIGYAIGNLPYGPISNRYGRKLAVYIGIILALIGAILIVVVNYIPIFWLFILGRFLMALGSSAGLTIAFAILGDTHQKEALTKKITYFMLVFAIGPGLAVALGGILTTQFGWASCFYFLIAYSLFLLVVTKFLPETNKEIDEKALTISKIKSGYLAKIKNKRLITSALLMGCGASFIYLFASEAPFIGINRIGLTPTSYGLLNFIPPIGMILGSLFANFLAGKKDPLFVILLGVFISFFASLIMLTLFLLDYVNITSLFLPMPFIYIGISLVFSNASSIALTHSKNKSNGSAMMNFINIATCVTILSAVESIATHQIFLMPLVFSFVALLMMFFKKRLSLLLSNV